MIKKLATALLGLLIAVGGPASGHPAAVPPPVTEAPLYVPYPPGCGPREIVVSVLKDQFSLGRVAMGLVAPGNVAILELYVSPSGGWAMLVTRAAGPPMTCLVSEGAAWQNVTPTREEMPL